MILSLCSGYGGLDMALEAVTGQSVFAHAENDPAACRILKHHWPDVPNLGDITSIDWAGVMPTYSSAVDWLTAGYP